jgi:hypothetical protein
MKYLLLTIGIVLILPLFSFFFWFIISMICLKIDEVKELWTYHKANQRERLKDKWWSKKIK